MLTEKTNELIYYRAYGSGGYLEDGDQVLYVRPGQDCTDAAVRSAHPMDQGENLDYGGIVNADVNGALTTTVNMPELVGQVYQACYYKPIILEPIQGFVLQQSGRRRRLNVVQGNWAPVAAYAQVGAGTADKVVETTPFAPPPPPSPSPAPPPFSYWVYDAATSGGTLSKPGFCMAQGATRIDLAAVQAEHPGFTSVKTQIVIRCCSMSGETCSSTFGNTGNNADCYVENVKSDSNTVPSDGVTWAEAKAICEASAVDVEWRDGDVALIDNYLMMHARRLWNGPLGSRKLLASLVAAPNCVSQRGASGSRL